MIATVWYENNFESITHFSVGTHHHISHFVLIFLGMLRVISRMVKIAYGTPFLLLDKRAQFSFINNCRIKLIKLMR